MAQLETRNLIVPSDREIRINPFLNWTIGQIVRHQGPASKLRKRFREEPYLDTITLAQLIGSPFALEEFMTVCRKLPHCGTISMIRLRALIESAAQGQIER